MDKQKIKTELKKLLRMEDELLRKFATQGHSVSDKQLRFVCGKIFEISDLILRLQNALAEIENER